MKGEISKLAKKFFTTESLKTFVDEIKAHVLNAISVKADITLVNTKQNKLGWVTDANIEDMFAGIYEGVENEEAEDVITGYVDENNNIIVSGDLASGTYTLKYENQDGTYTEIGTLEVDEIEGYTNLFSTSGDGFANNTDFSGASSGRFLTNYIPCKYGDVIHIKGATLYKAKFHNSVTDKWGDAIYAVALGVATSSYDDAVSVLTIGSGTGVSNIDKMQIEVRSGNTALDSVIITVNQDIVD